MRIRIHSKGASINGSSTNPEGQKELPSATKQEQIKRVLKKYPGLTEAQAAGKAPIKIKGKTYAINNGNLVKVKRNGGLILKGQNGINGLAMDTNQLPKVTDLQITPDKLDGDKLKGIVKQNEQNWKEYQKSINPVNISGKFIMDNSKAFAKIGLQSIGNAINAKEQQDYYNQQMQNFKEQKEQQLQQQLKDERARQNYEASMNNAYQFAPINIPNDKALTPEQKYQMAKKGGKVFGNYEDPTDDCGKVNPKTKKLIKRPKSYHRYV